MAEISLLDNDAECVADALSSACSGATRVRIAVAYAKGSGVVSLPSLTEVAERGSPVEVLAGIDFHLTDLAALEPFERPPSAARVYLMPDQSGRSSFHPKVYLVERGDEATAIVGSSNLSAGGMRTNVEANLVVRGAADDPLIRSVRGFHHKLWNSGFAFPVTGRFRESYQRFQRRRQDIELSLRAEADYVGAARDLKLAVVEAISSIPARGERNAWLLITSPENYIRNIEGSIWGDEKKRRIAQVRPGDSIYFYITRPMSQLGAMGFVTKELYEDHTIYWRDGKVYPYRFGFVGLIRPPFPIPFRPLVPSLDLFERRDDRNWGQRLQASMKALTPHDAEVLRLALTHADKAPSVA